MLCRRRTTEDGQALVEFTVVLPILMLILLAILQFGMVFKDYVALTDAVRAGARKGAVSRYESDPKATTEAAVVAAASDLGPKLEVTATSSWEPRSEVEVEGRYPYTIKLLNVVTITDGWLVSKTKERVE
jgi:Flp pilus assembly protein TadG